MNEGFFTPTVIKSYSKRTALPPQLHFKPPQHIPKAKSKSELPEIDQLIIDTECYPNYFLVKFKDPYTHEVLYSFECDENIELDCKGIRKVFKENEIITFNGNKYDIYMVRLALTGADNQMLKKGSDFLIKNNNCWNFHEVFEIEDLRFKHIDLIELTPGIVSLKIYGGRLNCRKLQDLPIPDDAILSEDDKDVVFDYCDNDLEVTETVYTELLPQIELRRTMSKKYKLDLLSKSDAQIAEAVIKSELEAISKEKLEKPGPNKHATFLYEVPVFIQFPTNETLNKALNIVTTKPFSLDGAGRPQMPEELTKLKVVIGKTTYKMGMGGLHSQEKAAYHLSDDNYTLYDWDVTSFYPSIMLLCDLYPKHLGRRFLKVFRKLVDERVEAKHNGDKVKADALKIVVNGTYGKLGSPYSLIYSPENMVQVTVTGQLSLLMLIDMMERKCISVVSGNTDGIVIRCKKDQESMMNFIIKRWEKQTGFIMEQTKYLGIYSRDVNNYIAIKENGEAKLKGCFRPPALDKNPENEVCTMAMVEYLKYGVPFEDTIKACKDITKFVTVRSVNGGALYNGKYLGKAVRWYHSTKEKGSITYQANGNQVAMTEDIKPLMVLPKQFPDDVDYTWYVNYCHELFGK